MHPNKQEGGAGPESLSPVCFNEVIAQVRAALSPPSAGWTV